MVGRSGTPGGGSNNTRHTSINQGVTMRIRTAVTAVLFLAAMQCAAQGLSLPPGPLHNHSFVVMGGWAMPVSHDGLTTFWGAGPSLGVEFLTSVNRWIALGFTVDGSAYWFRGPLFGTMYPGLSLRSPALAQIVAGVVGRYTIAPGKKLSPYVGAMIGISHVTGAEYRVPTDTLTTTYYYMPFQTRLALGMYAGLEYRFSRTFACDLESRALYVNNDPNVGLTAVVRGGFRFFF